MNFFLGTHMPHWLELTDVPLMVSHRKLAGRRRLPQARGPWVLDSGGYSELSLYGEWRTSASDYVTSVRRYVAEIGHMTWAVIQDWMCEPWVISNTGLTIQDHQAFTVDSYLDLVSRAPEILWCPVLQGWEPSDYLRHWDAYEREGVSLKSLPVVGVGSVCRRQGVRGAIDLLVRLHRDGLKIHGFGLKTIALRSLSSFLASSDSLAWSYNARKNRMRCGQPPRSCWNHLHRALEWRADLLSAVDSRPIQLGFGL